MSGWFNMPKLWGGAVRILKLIVVSGSVEINGGLFVWKLRKFKWMNFMFGIVGKSL